MTYKLGITMEDPRADQKNVSELMIPISYISSTDIHIFLQQTYQSPNKRERSSSNTKPKQGRPNIFLYQDYKKVRSSVVERFFGWLKSFRRIQTRYERLASTTYLGFIQLLYNNDTNENFQKSSTVLPTKYLQLNYFGDRGRQVQYR